MKDLKINVEIAAHAWTMSIANGDRLVYTDLYDPHNSSVFGPFAFRYFMAGLYWQREFADATQKELANEMYDMAETYFIKVMGMSTDISRYNSMVYTKKSSFYTDDNKQIDAKKVLRIDTASGKGRKPTNRVFYEFSMGKRQVRINSDTPSTKHYLLSVEAFYLKHKSTIESLLEEVA